MIHATHDALQHLRGLLAERAAEAGVVGLRLGVERGGCAGWQYVMQISEPQEGDEVVEQEGVRLIIAADSRELLRGVELDYHDSLNDAGFKINNPRAVRSCGCGTSFEAPPDVSPSSR